MGSSWQLTTLGELGEVARGRSRHRPRYAEHLYGGDYPFIQTGDVKAANGRINQHTQTYSEAGLLQSRLWPKNTLCITIAANIAETGILDYPACFPDSIIGFIADNRKCDVFFIEYMFRYLRRRIQHEASGSVQDNINLQTIERLHFYLPFLQEQKAIAHILGNLDEKIELNRQMNSTLESMAQAMFKSWFVDFDPVIDNALAAGNPIPESLKTKAEKRRRLGDQRKTLPQEIQQQFPSRFVFTEELGWIPEGWEVSTVGEEFFLTMGQSPPGSSYNEEGIGIPFFQGRADFSFRYPSNRVYCTAPKRLASKDDTLVSVRAPVGEINMATEDCCIGRGVSATRHKTGSRSFTYYAMLQLRKNFKVFEAEGTVFGSINQKNFKTLPQLRVSRALIKAFEEKAGSLDEKIAVNTRKITTLTSLRDTLLPKLISGQLRLPDSLIDKFTEQANTPDAEQIISEAI